jgi:hypothetical protein
LDKKPHSYAEAYRAACGEDEKVGDLIPFMLEQFLDGDRGFAAATIPSLPRMKAFFLRDTKTRGAFEKAYAETQSLYYRDQPTFSEILAEIGANAERL